MYLSDLFSETVERVRPRSNIDDVAKMAAVFIGFFIFIAILVKVVVF